MHTPSPVQKGNTSKGQSGPRFRTPHGSPNSSRARRSLDHYQTDAGAGTFFIVAIRPSCLNSSEGEDADDEYEFPDDYTMTPEMLEELLECEMRATTSASGMPPFRVSSSSTYRIIAGVPPLPRNPQGSAANLSTVQSPLTNAAETPEVNHSATPTFHQLREAAQLSQIRKSSLNTACRQPLILTGSSGPFFTQQDPFDDSEETDSGELDSNNEDDLQFSSTGPVSRTKGSSLDDTKGAYIQRLNLWHETNETRQLHGSSSQSTCLIGCTPILARS